MAETSKILRRAVLVLIFGVPQLIFQLGAILIVWPFITAMDWLIEGEANPRANFHEMLGIGQEFITTLRSVR
jgi:hypothetical protein